MLFSEAVLLASTGELDGRIDMSRPGNAVISYVVVRSMAKLHRYRQLDKSLLMHYQERVVFVVLSR